MGPIEESEKKEIIILLGNKARLLLEKCDFGSFWRTEALNQKYFMFVCFVNFSLPYLWVEKITMYLIDFTSVPTRGRNNKSVPGQLQNPTNLQTWFGERCWPRKWARFCWQCFNTLQVGKGESIDESLP